MHFYFILTSKKK
jgi:carbamoyl-phosphate synthase/aspartate carbamoyltransferase/dihydroorotase